MSFRTWPTAGRLIAGAAIGGVLALGIGLLVMAVLPNDDGWTDLGVAAFTTVIGIPGGAVIGGFFGWFLGRNPQPSAGTNETSTSA